METATGDEEETKLRYDPQKHICRCCLSTEKQMKGAMQVQKYFMELTGINVSLPDGMPQSVCVECVAVMQKAISFKYKMLRAHSVLYEHLARFTQGPVDPTTPELSRYKTPLLGATETLTFDSFQEKIGYHKILQQQNQVRPWGLGGVPARPLFASPQAACESVEATFSDCDDDPLENYKNAKNEAEDNENTGEEDLDEDLEEDLEEEEDLAEEEDTEEESSDSDNVKSEPETDAKHFKIPPVTKIEKSSVPDVSLIDVPWSSENDRALIEFVRENEPLYNPKHELYKIAVLKQKLWRDVADILNKTDSDCYKRWCYVRDYYIRRRGKARCGEAARHRAQLLAFLDHVPSPQRSWVVSSPEREREDREEEERREDVKMEALAIANEEPDPWEGIRIGDQYSKMSNAPWDSESDDVLIELVRRHQALYNPRCKEFRKVQLKQGLWREIAHTLNKTESACYKRWCYVRDYYVRRKSNPGALSSGKAARRRAQRLAFLDRLDRPARTDTHKTESKPRESSTEAASSASLPGFTALRYRLGGYSKKSSPSSWTAEHDDVLIDFVRCHAALYNPRSKHARSARGKHALWTQLAAKLGRTDTDCCRRWCYIRDYYVRRRGKPGVLCSGAAARHRAARLAFLDALGTQKEDQDFKSDDEAHEGEQACTEFNQHLNKIPDNTLMSWTSESDALLIDFVKHNEPLYNPKNRNAELKMKLWSDVASMLDKTDSDCYKRWCYVRDYYTRRKGKGRGGEAAKRRAQLLAFLDAVPSPQRAKYN